MARPQVIVAAELTNAANDTTMFAPLVDATETNLVNAGRPEAVGTYVADAGYWSVPNVCHPVDAEVLITPMPATKGITDPDDPRIAERQAVMDRVDAGELTIKAAAAEIGVSETWARKLRDDRRIGVPDAARLRKDTLDRLATDEGRSLYAHRKITTEPVFGNIKANLRFRRFSRRGMPAATSEWRLICAVHKPAQTPQRPARLRLTARNGLSSSVDRCVGTDGPVI